MKKVLVGMLVLVMLLQLCSFAVADSSGTKSEPLEFSFMMAYWVDQPLQLENNYLFEEFQKKMNVKLDLTLIPWANYIDKAMLKLASGDVPNVMWINDATVKTKAVIDAAEAGAFWDCTDFLNSDMYPNLKWAISSTMIANASINGRVYGMPGPRPSARNGLFYRSDLFEKYNIPIPSDIDTFYEAAKQLKENEPNVIPFSYSSYGNETRFIYFLTVSQGGYNGWGLKDDKIVPSYDTPEFKKTLTVLRKMYAEGLINQDFAILQGAERQAAITSGKAGMYAGVYDDYEFLQPALSKVDPKAKLGLVPVFNGVTNAQVGSALYVIPKTVSEEKLHAIFKYFDSSLEQDILTWEYFGEEGRNYTLVDGMPKFISDDAKAEAQKTLLIYKSCAVNPVVIHWPSDSDITKTWKNATEQYAESAVRNFASPLLSDTQTEKGAELDKIMEDARVQYIMGEIDEAGYDAAVSLWYAQGGTQIIEEYTAAYQKSLE